MTEFSQGSRRQQDGAARQYHREHYIERREQSPYAAAIKPRERVHAAVEFIHQNAADQKTGNDEEYIDTDEPAGQQTTVGVIEHNGNDRDRAQSLNVCAKLTMRRSYWVSVTSRRQGHRRTRIPGRPRSTVPTRPSSKRRRSKCRPPFAVHPQDVAAADSPCIDCRLAACPRRGSRRPADLRIRSERHLRSPAARICAEAGDAAWLGVPGCLPGAR